MNRKEQTSISGHLTKSYMMLFPFFILMIILIITLGTFLSNQWMECSIFSAKYTATKLLQSDIDTLDVKAITEHGGSVIAVDLQGRVTLIGGTPLFTKQTLNMEEWTSFLTSCSSPEGSYNYTVAYEETKDFWLVVGFPSSIRINISVAANTRSTTFGKSVLFCSLLLLMLFLLLFISSLIYARLSAKTFITPLRQLCSIVKRMTCGNYHE